jgi:hypothetical protein
VHLEHPINFFSAWPLVDKLILHLSLDKVGSWRKGGREKGRRGGGEGRKEVGG